MLAILINHLPLRWAGRCKVRKTILVLCILGCGPAG